MARAHSSEKRCTRTMPSDTSSGPEEAKLWDRRVWLAGWLDQASRGDKSGRLVVEPTLSQLHLAALRSHSASASGILAETHTQGSAMTQLATVNPETATLPTPRRTTREPKFIAETELCPARLKYGAAP